MLTNVQKSHKFYKSITFLLSTSTLRQNMLLMSHTFCGWCCMKLTGHFCQF